MILINNIKDFFSKNLHKTLIVLISLVLYSNTIKHDYVYDDNTYILSNPIVQSGFTGIKYAFTNELYNHLPDFKVKENLLYRPILIISFCLENGLFGNTPLSGHIINILLYALTALFLYDFILFYFKDHFSKVQILFIVLLFVSHPIHTEVVANIKSRDEILSFLFGLISFNKLYKYIKGSKQINLYMSIVFFLIALLSKESSISFFGIIVLLLYFLKPFNLKKTFQTLFPYIIVIILFLIIRQLILPDVDGNLNPVDNYLSTFGFIDRLGTVLFILLKYLKLFFLPFPLVYDYSFDQIPLHDILSTESIVSFFLYSIILVFGIILLIRRKVIGFGLCFYLVMLSVSSNFFITIGTIMGERLMYTPLLGIIIVFVCVIYKILQEKASFIIIIIILPIFSFMTIKQNEVWTSNLTLAKNGVKYAPNSTRTHQQYGNELFYKYLKTNNRLYKEKAIIHLNKSLNIYIDNHYSLITLAEIYRHEKKLDMSFYCIYKAYKLYPKDILIKNSMYKLGVKSIENNNLKLGEKIIEVLLKIDKKEYDYIDLLGILKFKMGQFKEAVEVFEKLYSINPDNKTNIKNLISSYNEIGNTLKSQEYQRILAAL